jgi:radical SAM protein (TIGR01212 family)
MKSLQHTALYNKFSLHLRQTFGQRVQKLPLCAGFSCPNRDGALSYEGCLYCNQTGSASPLLDNLPSLKDQFKQGRKTLTKKYGSCKFLAYFQAFSNTYAPVGELQKLYDEVLGWDKENIVGLAIGTRPDCIPDEVLNLLQGYAQRYYLWLELGLQSCHDRTLNLINRGHNAKQFSDAVKRAKLRDLRICTHIILGLPEETKEEMRQTAHFLNKCRVDAVKIHGLYVLKDTPLAQIYQQGEYTPLTFSEYVSLTCDFLEILSPDIIIQRLTSDPPAKELLAPEWMLDKFRIINAIEDELNRRNSEQGAKL